MGIQGLSSRESGHKLDWPLNSPRHEEKHLQCSEVLKSRTLKENPYVFCNHFWESYSLLPFASTSKKGFHFCTCFSLWPSGEEVLRKKKKAAKAISRWGGESLKTRIKIFLFRWKNAFCQKYLFLFPLKIPEKKKFFPPTENIHWLQMNWCEFPEQRQQYLLREPGWFLVGPHLLDGCWQTRFHLPRPPPSDSRNFHSQASISLGKSSLKITYIIYFSLETASSPLLSINNSSHQPLGLMAPSLKAALTLMCLFLFSFLPLNHSVASNCKPQYWDPEGVDVLLPSSLGLGSFLRTPVAASCLSTWGLLGWYLKLKQCHETKEGDCME